MMGGQVVVGTGALGGALKRKQGERNAHNAMILLSGSWSGVVKHA